MLVTMATEHDDALGNHWELNSILSELQNSNKAKRKRALVSFNKHVFQEDREPDKENLAKILHLSLTHLRDAMNDPSEVNRAVAFDIILKFIDNCAVTEKQLIDIISVAHHRLATIPIVEESEDVRLQIIAVLSALTLTFQAKLIPFMNDIVNTLKVAVEDSSPDVRKAACECVSSYARATQDKFHLQSQTLVRPLLKVLHHHRFRNRIASIHALGKDWFAIF